MRALRTLPDCLLMMLLLPPVLSTRLILRVWRSGGGAPDCRVGVDCWPIKDWALQEAAVHTWMSHARSLAPSFTAPLTLPQPTVRLTASAALRPSAVSDPYEPRVALLREDCAEPCLHLLVANVMTHSPISFTVRMSGPGIDGAATASRIFGAEYEVPIGATPLSPF